MSNPTKDALEAYEAPTPVSHITEEEVNRLSVENERLRHVVSDCAAALVTGAFISPKASVDFMEKLPKEISLVVSSLRNNSGNPPIRDFDIDRLAIAFQDGFTHGNASWDGTPDHHKELFREGIKCLCASLAPKEMGQ